MQFLSKARSPLNTLSKLPVPLLSTGGSYETIRLPILYSIDSHRNYSLVPGRGIFHNCSSFIFSTDVKRGINSSTAVFSEDSDAIEDKPAVDPAKDRSKIIPPEVSIRYMESSAYNTTYGDDPIWTKFRRNFKGRFAPKKTLKTCIRSKVISTGNPCPICRDEYLVLHYTNVKLLKQFISPYTGEIYSTAKTSICQKKQFQLEVAINQAKFYGFITYDVPFRIYDYSEFYPQLKG